MANMKRGAKVAKMSAEEKKQWMFWQNADYLRRINCMTNAQLCKVLKCSENTLRTRLRDPGTTLAAEQVAISEHFKVPVEQMFLPFEGREVERYAEAVDG